MGVIFMIMFPIMIAVFALGTGLQIKEWLRLRNGCGKHIWIYDPWNEPHWRQARWCDKCGITQVRLSDEYFWSEKI